VPHTPGPTSNKAISSSTPGPWEIDDLFGDTHITAMRNGMPCNVVTGMYDEENEPTIEELKANARLIAAATFMLTALELLADIDPHPGTYSYKAATRADLEICLANVRRIARAATAEAEGG